MFEDVRDARCVWRIRFEADGEDIIGIIPGDVKVVGSGLLVVEP